MKPTTISRKPKVIPRRIQSVQADTTDEVMSFLAKDTTVRQHIDVRILQALRHARGTVNLHITQNVFSREVLDFLIDAMRPVLREEFQKEQALQLTEDEGLLLDRLAMLWKERFPKMTVWAAAKRSFIQRGVDLFNTDDLEQFGKYLNHRGTRNSLRNIMTRMGFPRKRCFKDEKRRATRDKIQRQMFSRGARREGE